MSNFINNNAGIDNDFLASDLASLISGWGEQALNSVWLCKNVECYGGQNTDELDLLSDQQRQVDGQELLRIVSEVDNIADGYFSAFLKGEKEPWLIVRAIDNSIYVYKYESSQPLPPPILRIQTKPATTPSSTTSQDTNAPTRFSLAINDNGLAVSQLLEQMQAKGSDPENFIIFIADEKKNYYIQATPHHSNSAWLYTEAVGNESLDPEYALQPAQLEQMRKLGWKKDPYSPNFIRVWPVTSVGDRRFIAMMIKQTFVKVYGMRPRQAILVEIMSPRASTTSMGQRPPKSNWDPVAYAEHMKKSTSPVSAFFLIDSLESISTCIQWLSLLKAYNMPSMEQSKYFDDVRDIYESGREVMNFDHSFRLAWENQDLQGLLRCHFFDKGRYEIELWLPGVIANAVALEFGDGHNGFWCAFMPPAFYD
jgi:type III secretion system-like peptide-binding chaperone